MSTRPPISERQARFQQVLADIKRSGVYHLPPGAAADILAAALALDYAVFQIDLSAVTNKNLLLAGIAEAMDFPDWFGQNWDALADALGDLEWQAGAGWLVVLQHADQINSQAHEDFVTALSVLAAAADEWRSRHQAFWCLVDMHADGIAWLPAI